MFLVGCFWVKHNQITPLIFLPHQTDISKSQKWLADTIQMARVIRWIWSLTFSNGKSCYLTTSCNLLKPFRFCFCFFWTDNDGLKFNPKFVVLMYWNVLLLQWLKHTKVWSIRNKSTGNRCVYKEFSKPEAMKIRTMELRFAVLFILGHL